MSNHSVPRAIKAAAFILIGSIASFLSAARGDEPFIQADVYNSLYEAYIQCDENFGQSRTEFITEKLEQGTGEINIKSLKKILTSNIEMANQTIAAGLIDSEIVQKQRRYIEVHECVLDTL